MRQFLKVLKRYAAPYGGYLGGSVVLNVLSAVFNIFSFSLLIPILQILFNINEMSYEFMAWNTPGASLTDLAVNNLYWFVSGLMVKWGAGNVLLALCLALSVITAVKTACYFGASAIMVPIRTGIV
ncbi:MAG: ABC transporter ATP-binding protein, partial [Bacteroidales bacterium]|nr:ABC transporter ATP-binding protein [Bacteroidales bacterium]